MPRLRWTNATPEERVDLRLVPKEVRERFSHGETASEKMRATMVLKEEPRYELITRRNEGRDQKLRPRSRSKSHVMSSRHALRKGVGQHLHAVCVHQKRSECHA